eukprot:SAG31_NODE_10603_length_1118_cov_1.297350_2_plen_25_part_01
MRYSLTAARPTGRRTAPRAAAGRGG